MKWNHKISIKHLIEDEMPDDANLTPHIRMEVIRELLTLPSDPEIDDLRDELQDTSWVVTVADFDNWLENFYNYADTNLVWVG